MNEQLLQRLDLLASKLGVTAQYLWSVLVKQARITLIEDVVFVILTVAFTYFVVRYWKWLLTGRHDEPAYILPVIAASLNILAICLSAAALLEIPTLIFNPEYYALTKILEAVKQ